MEHANFREGIRLNRYKKTSTALFIYKIRREMKKMASELNEHRYYLEQNVERRTELLAKRIEMLEACNASLCSKLAQSQRKLAALQEAAEVSAVAGLTDRDARLDLVNTRIKAVVQKQG